SASYMLVLDRACGDAPL
ncbi:hypothetical protein A2U01_0056088, partial [Trifolium medium]|nr:hypothetical protein [Trifolium medium]